MSSNQVVDTGLTKEIGPRSIVDAEGSFTGTVSDPVNEGRIFLLQQDGKIWIYNKSTGSVLPEPFLDLSDKIQQLYEQKPMEMGGFADERGLLALAFHPEYATQGSLFQGVFIVIYSDLANPDRYRPEYRQDFMDEVPNPDNMTCIVQYRVGKNLQQTLSSQKDILCIPEPEANHNGGGLQFGPGGYLYIGLGDGGGANDEHGPLLDPSKPDSFLGNGQNLSSLHGKILRIGVVQTMDQSVPYIVPSDNPLVGQNVGYVEIANWGFRNPWRMSFHNSDLYVGDVGQNRFEMVKLVQGLGKNYLWRGYEGFEVFNSEVAQAIDQASQEKMFPIISYPRDLGVSIVGVSMYQENRITQLAGKLIIADYSGRVMVGSKDGDNWTLESLFKLESKIHSLDVINDEPYLTAYNNESNTTMVLGLSHLQEEMSRNGQKETVQGTEQLTDDDINRIVEQAVGKARQVKSLLGRENGQPTHTRMHIAIIKNGEEEAQVYRSMDDAWAGSFDIAKRKAYTAYAFSSRYNALTTRGMQALSQLKKIEGTMHSNGQIQLTAENIPLHHIGNSNPSGGIIEFPGGIPLYKNGILVGAIGVSGDGVDQDEAVARAGSVGYEAPKSIRSDTVANIPYYKE